MGFGGFLARAQLVDYHNISPNRHIRAISVQCSVRFRTRDSRGLKRGFLLRNILTKLGCNEEDGRGWEI